LAAHRVECWIVQEFSSDQMAHELGHLNPREEPGRTGYEKTDAENPYTVLATGAADVR
jgi:hypothetical protein